jgi:alkylated DNA repair dioxygenase AlkB
MDLIPIPGAEVYYEKHFLAPEEASHCFDTLLNQCAWERRRASFAQMVPRDEAYYGDPGTRYRYSRRDYSPLPWLPQLLALKARIEQATPMAAYANSNLPYFGYNAVLCNLYRDGNDSVGLHADAEPEMGPVIASLSLGGERVFRLKQNNGSLAFSERLPNGSLLIMAGTTQKNLKHELPKERGILHSRINLTFRHIHQV